VLKSRRTVARSFRRSPNGLRPVLSLTTGPAARAARLRTKDLPDGASIARRVLRGRQRGVGERDQESGAAATAAAPLYLTRLTREQLGGDPLLARTLPEARVFSAESARELGSFVLRANLETLMVRAMGATGEGADAPRPRRGH